MKSILAGLVAAIMALFGASHPSATTARAPQTSGTETKKALTAAVGALDTQTTAANPTATTTVPIRPAQSSPSTSTPDPNLSNYVTKSDFESSLATLSGLSASLQHLIAAYPLSTTTPVTQYNAASEGVAANGNGIYPYAGTNRIGNLSGVTISNSSVDTASLPDLSGSYLSLKGGTIAGNLTVNGTFSGGTLNLLNASSSRLSVFGNAYFGGSATSTFTSTGWLGIGTTSPFRALSVQGDGYISGTINIGPSSSGSAISSTYGVSSPNQLLPYMTSWKLNTANVITTLPGTWKSNIVGMGFDVAYDSAAGNYKMLYAGYDGATTAQIGLAHSADGQTWLDDSASSPFITPTSMGCGGLTGPQIYQENGIWYVYMICWTGAGYEIGTPTIILASGPSLSALTLVGTMLTPSNVSWAGAGGVIYLPRVLKSDGTYYMFFNGGTAPGHESIGYATAASPSGPWTASAAPVLTATQFNASWTQIADPFLVRLGNYWLMYLWTSNGGVGLNAYTTAAAFPSGWTPTGGQTSNTERYAMIWQNGVPVLYTGDAGSSNISTFSISNPAQDLRNRYLFQNYSTTGVVQDGDSIRFQVDGTGISSVSAANGLYTASKIAFAPSYGSVVDTTIHRANPGVINLGTGSNDFISFDNANSHIYTALPLVWPAAWGGSADTGVSRCGAGLLCVGTGAQGSAAGGIQSATGIFTSKAGIGTTSPYALLSIANSASTAANTPLFVIASTTGGTATTTVLSVASTGNLTITGSAATCTLGNGSSATNCSSSDQRLKDNITSLDSISSLTAIRQLNPVSFNWNTWMIGNGSPTTTQYGFIAQQVAPVFNNLVSEDPNTHYYKLDYQGLFAPIVGAIQALANEVSGFADSFTTKELTFTRGTGDEIDVQKLCVGSTCITESQLQTLLASASAATAGSPSNSSASTSTAASTPPVIQINGNNPAYVSVGDSYADLGATITGPQADLNLGIKTFLNGVLLSNIVVDTSAAATDTIDYVVTDQNGLTSTSTRAVIIQAPQTAAVSSSDATTSAATSTPQ